MPAPKKVGVAKCCTPLKYAVSAPSGSDLPVSWQRRGRRPRRPKTKSDLDGLILFPLPGNVIVFRPSRTKNNSGRRGRRPLRGYRPTNRNFATCPTFIFARPPQGQKCKTSPVARTKQQKSEPKAGRRRIRISFCVRWYVMLTCCCWHHARAPPK